MPAAAVPGLHRLSRLQRQTLQGRRATGLLGLLVLAIIAVPTSRLLAYATPVIDGLLIVLGVLLLAGRNSFERLPGMRVPVVANPFRQA